MTNIIGIMRDFNRKFLFETLAPCFSDLNELTIKFANNFGSLLKDWPLQLNHVVYAGSNNHIDIDKDVFVKLWILSGEESDEEE